LWTFGIYTREYDLDGLPFTVATEQTINWINGREFCVWL
jgi:hypothetical protein